MSGGYESFAPFYDALTEDVDYAGWAEYFLALIKRHGGRCGQMLDLACGSGSLTLELIDHGVDVVAVDGSPEMLTIAREKAMSAGAEALFLCQDMRELDLYGTVDSAVCFLDSLNHVLSTAELAEIFRRLGLFIAPDGLLLFDVNTPHKHAVTLADNTFVFEEEEFLCLWRNQYNALRHETSMQLDFFVQQEEGIYARYTDEVRERAYTLRTWEKLLSCAGFDCLAVYGERSFNPPAAQTDRWVFVARNRAVHQIGPKE